MLAAEFQAQSMPAYGVDSTTAICGALKRCGDKII